MRKIYDSPHQCFAISNWKKYGLLCREGETYKDIYYHVMSVNNCELCNVEFTEEIKNQRCMDHDHNTGYFRKVLCRACNTKFMVTPQKIRKNSKTGHKWIGIGICNDREGKVPRVSFRYTRKGFRRKASTSLTKLIALSFIHLLKEPI